MAEPRLTDLLQNRIQPLQQPMTWGKGSVQAIPSPQTTQGTMIDHVLRSFGQPMYDATVGGIEGRVSPEDGAWTLLTRGPMGPLGSVRAPTRSPTFSLSPNMAQPQREGHPLFRYEIHRDGRPAGQVVEGHVMGDTAFIEWWGEAGRFGDTGNPAGIGVRGLRQLREAMRSDFPGVTTFAGRRISGSRGSWDNPPWQEVVIPSLAAPVAGGGLAGFLQQGQPEQ